MWKPSDMASDNANIVVVKTGLILMEEESLYILELFKRTKETSWEMVYG